MTETETTTLTSLDATAQAELVRNGDVSPTELVEAAIARVEQVNPELNAVIHELFEEGRAEAESADLPDGPFKGVPFLFKDLGAAYAGQPMHLGMRLLKEANFRAPMDSYLAERFRAAGFVVIGKTNTPELGILPTSEPVAYGATRNPWNTEHTSGGSSGGSGAAVASGMVPVAHANDGGGSIRIPASINGLVGLKTTRQRMTEGPMIGDMMGGLTVELAVTHTVRDTASILDAVHGPAPGDPYAAPQPSRPYVDELEVEPTFRIGFAEHPAVPGLESHPDCIAAVRAARDLLVELGHEVEESSPLDAQMAEALNLEDTFLTRWAAGQAATLDQLGVLLGRADHRRRRRAADLGARGGGTGPLGRSLPRRHRPASDGRPRHRRLARDRLRPAADADDGGAAGAAWHLRPVRSGSDGRLPARDPGGGVHGDLQLHRPAGDLAAAALERRGSADRHPARRPVRPRGSADPGCRPARASAAVGGPSPAGLRGLTDNVSRVTLIS